MSEETIFDQNEVKEEKQGGEPMNDEETVLIERTNPSSKAPKGKKKKDYKTAGIAGAAGVAGVAIGVLTPVNVFPDALADGDGVTNVLEPEPVPSASGHLQGHDMDVATGVDDSMSFSQAFAAARHEVGPGGLFVWHGNTYGTYYANEWNAMSPEEHDQYWADVHHTTSSLNEDAEEIPNFEPIGDTEDGQEADLLSDNQEQQETEEPQEAEIQQENLEGGSTNIEEEIEDELNHELDEQADNIDNLEQIELSEENILEVDDLSGNEALEEAVLEVDDNVEVDAVVDMDAGDESIDSVIVDSEVDDNGELPVAEVNGLDDGVDEVVAEEEAGTTLDSIDGTNEMLSSDEIESLDLDGGFVDETPDVDDLASFESDPNVTIDNNIDMSDFV